MTAPAERTGPDVILWSLDLRTPRSGMVNPDTCPVCRRLREHVTAAICTRSPTVAGAVVRAMHTHMVHGHPNDPRNLRPAE